MEIHKSESTMIKIEQLLSCDLDDDGINDVDEVLPKTDEIQSDPDENPSEDNPKE